MIFLQYAKCSTCKKAKKWLDEHGIVYTDRPIKEEHPSADELKEWHAKKIGRASCRERVSHQV